MHISEERIWLSSTQRGVQVQDHFEDVRGSARDEEENGG